MPDRSPIPTRASLLSRLKSPDDRESWQIFYDTYRKLIHGYAVNARLTGDEAEEVVQETLIEVSERIKTFNYDVRIGSFKAWLFHLTQWRITDQFRQRRPADIALDGLTDEELYVDALAGTFALPCVEPDSQWEQEWRQALLEAAMRKLRRTMRPGHFQLFDLLVVKEWPIARVSEVLRLNAAYVNLVKFRAMRLLKKEIARLEKRGV